MTKPQLIQVKRRVSENSVGVGVELRWKSGEEDFLASSTLRQHCPCASCQQLRGDSSHEKPLSERPAPAGRSLLRVVKTTVGEAEDLREIRPVGNYALNLLWGDKHDSGIFSYLFLYELAHPPVLASTASESGAV